MNFQVNKITILSDKNCWMNKYNKSLTKFLYTKGIKSKLIFNYKDIKPTHILFIFSYSKIIPKKYLEINRYNIVAHGSNLPKGRGFSPISWEILQNKSSFFISFFEASQKFDEGKIYIKKKFKINRSDLINEWREVVGNIIINNSIKLIYNISNIKMKSQIGKITKYRRRKPIDSKLNINKSLKNQFNLLRIVDNKKYPAYFEYKGYKYILRIKKLNEANKKNKI